MGWTFLIATVLTAAVAVAGWIFNDWRRRKWEEYKRREDRYIALIKQLPGFYETTPAEDARIKKTSFITQTNLCWLYCPDDVIRTIHHFLEGVQAGQQIGDDEKSARLGAVLVAVRKDLKGPGTKLGEKDVRTFTST